MSVTTSSDSATKLKAFAEYVLTRSMQGASASEITDEVALRYDLDPDQASSLVDAAVEGMASGMDEAIRRGVRAGVQNGIDELRRGQRTSLVPGLWQPLLRVSLGFLGLLLVLVAVGGYLAGNLLLATVVLVMGLTSLGMAQK